MTRLNLSRLNLLRFCIFNLKKVNYKKFFKKLNKNKKIILFILILLSPVVSIAQECPISDENPLEGDNDQLGLNYKTLVKSLIKVYTEEDKQKKLCNLAISSLCGTGLAVTWLPNWILSNKTKKKIAISCGVLLVMCNGYFYEDDKYVGIPE